MEPWLLLIGAAAFLIARRWARAAVVRLWLDERITNRQAAVLFGAIAILPVALIATWFVGRNPPGTPLIVLVLIFALAPAIGLFAAAMDYMSTNGVKEQMRRNRDGRDAP